jgi:hypothetical protein
VGSRLSNNVIAHDPKKWHAWTRPWTSADEEAGNTLRTAVPGDKRLTGGRTWEVWQFLTRWTNL